MGTLLTNDQAHGTVRTPSSAYAPGDGLPGNAKTSSPVGQQQGLAVRGNIAIARPVPSLLRGGSPADIVRAIWPVCVRKSVQRMLRSWPPPDRCQKGFIGSEQEFNTTAPIPGVAFITTILTTGLGRIVCSVFWRVGAGLRFAMRSQPLPCPVSGVTSARYSRTCGQVLSEDDSYLSTVAEALPLQARTFPCRRTTDAFLHHEAPKALARQIPWRMIRATFSHTCYDTQGAI